MHKAQKRLFSYEDLNSALPGYMYQYTSTT